jgi:hypothetical protein
MAAMIADKCFLMMGNWMADSVTTASRPLKFCS